MYTEHNQRQKLIEYIHKHMHTQQIDCLAPSWTLKTASPEKHWKIYIGACHIRFSLESCNQITEESFSIKYLEYTF